MKKTIATLFAAGLIVLLAGALKAEDVKIVVIDSQRILYESLEGKEAYKKLSAIKDQKSAELDKKQSKIKTMNDQLQAKSATMTAAAKDDLQAKYEKEVRDYNRMLKDAQEDMRKSELDLLKPFSKDLEAVIKSYCEKNKIDIVLDKQNPAMIHASPRIDITKDVITAFDKQYQENASKQKEKKE